MADSVINRDTALNLVVNVIPLGIILFFVVLFLTTDPFGSDVVAVFYSQLLLVVPFLSLALVTYVSGRIISETEQNGYSTTSRAITKALIGETANDSDPSESETE